MTWHSLRAKLPNRPPEFGRTDEGRAVTRTRRPMALALILDNDRWVALTTLGLLVLVWFSLTLSGMVRDIFLPGPSILWAGFLDLVEHGYKDRTLWEHVQVSLQRVVLGFGTGSIAGTVLGLAMGYSEKVEAFFKPLVEFFRPLPQLAYLVLLIVWLGIGDAARIMLLFLTALPVASVAARDGVRSVSIRHIQAARSLGANGWHVFRYVIFPSALPEIFTGARLAIGVVYATLIAAEIIAGNSGLGWMILDAGRFLRSDYVFVGIILLGVLGLLLDRLVLLVELRVVHWAGKG